MIMHRQLCRNRILLALTVAFASLWSAVNAAEVTAVPIGVCLSLTGPFQDYGNVAMAGINLFVDDFNSRSSITGLKLAIKVRDDKSDPSIAAEIVEELVTNEKVPAIIGPTTSAIMTAMIKKAKQHEVVLISPYATSPTIGTIDDWSFTIQIDDKSQGEALADLVAIKLKRYNCGVIINDSFPYGASLFSGFRDRFEKEGGRIVAEEHYNWDLDENETPDFTGILMMLKEFKPEVK